MARHTTTGFQSSIFAGQPLPALGRISTVGRSALRRSVMAVWIVTPLMPGIGAVISWFLGL